MMSKARYIRHPYLIARAIDGFFEWKLGRRRRTEQYERYERGIEEGLQDLLTVDASTIAEFKSQFCEKVEFQESMREARDSLNKCGSIGGWVDKEASTLLYVICRVLQPKIVLETGVASGFSSATILQALEDNAIGQLHSLDLHYRDGVTIPAGRRLGWVIPEQLKHRWHLVLGESVKLLPRLLKELGPVDVFFHDSRHTYRTMMKEYTMVWPHLDEGGLLLSDDVRFNDAFLDFCEKVDRLPVLTSNIGATVK